SPLRGRPSASPVASRSGSASWRGSPEAAASTAGSLPTAPQPVRRHRRGAGIGFPSGYRSSGGQAAVIVFSPRPSDNPSRAAPELRTSSAAHDGGTPMPSSRALAFTVLLLLPGAARAEDLVLGMSAAFKGPSRGLGIELYRGAMACFAEVNATGGVHGRKIRIQAYDDGYQPGPAVANTVRLIRDDKVFLLFGYVGTPTVTRVLPLLKRFDDRSVYLFCPFTGAEPQRRPPYDAYVFNLRASYGQETAGLVNHFVAVGRKRIAVFYQIDAYGRSGWDGVRT